MMKHNGKRKQAVAVQLATAVWDIQDRERRAGKNPPRYYAELLHALLSMAAFVAHERGIDINILKEECDRFINHEYGRLERVVKR